jgi:hypothetical protein
MSDYDGAEFTVLVILGLIELAVVAAAAAVAYFVVLTILKIF